MGLASQGASNVDTFVYVHFVRIQRRNWCYFKPSFVDTKKLIKKSSCERKKCFLRWKRWGSAKTTSLIGRREHLAQYGWSLINFYKDLNSGFWDGFMLKTNILWQMGEEQVGPRSHQILNSHNVRVIDTYTYNPNLLLPFFNWKEFTKTSSVHHSGALELWLENSVVKSAVKWHLPPVTLKSWPFEL